MSYNLPHRANKNEIIRVKGAEDLLFLVREYSEHVEYRIDGGRDEAVTYTIQNVDKPEQIRVIEDGDIASIVVTAERSEQFIKARTGEAPKLISTADDVGEMKVDITDIAKQFKEERAKKTKPGNRKKAKSPHELARIKEVEDREYIDYLLDLYSVLVDLENILGTDETRQEEIAMIKEEFLVKSASFYGRNNG